MHLLRSYGLTDRFSSQAAAYPAQKLARVTAQYQGLYKIVTDERETLAELSGKLSYQLSQEAQLALYPAVGDFVMVSLEPGDERARIQEVLHRKSAFTRTAVGVTGQTQVVASNIDIVFLCMALDGNYNLSRVERYLSIAWDSGATPVILLTKADLCGDLPHAVAEVERVSAFADVHAVSMLEGVDEVFAKYLREGVTAAFIGSSGVGKSTLVNRLLGGGTLATQALGRAGKGQHTTTGRELFVLPQGGVVIDTPGMRELGAEYADLSKSFEDIEALAAQCRFRDCTHTAESGCAVRAAAESGALEARRLQNYFKMKHESDYDGLSSREIQAKKLERMFREVGGMKNARKALKESDKRKGR